MRGSAQQARTELAERLRARHPEIERALLARVRAIAGHSAALDPAYHDGLHGAVSAALDYGIAGIELPDDRLPPVPVALLAQARLAARHRVGLDTVLRRYSAGHALIGDFLVEEADRLDLSTAELQSLLRAQAARFDLTLTAVSEEHAREQAGRLPSDEQRRADRVERLLAGEPLDTFDLAYDLDGLHLGLLAVGPVVAEAIRGFAATLDRRLLLVRRDSDTVWAWLGGRHPTDPAQLEALATSALPAGSALALGEPAEGLEGWRLSHRQAVAALPLIRRGSERVGRYADVALLASVVQDDLLAISLRRLYLAPLEDGRGGGEILRETLRVYFAAGHNGASAASILGVSRQTISNRLKAIEERLGRPLTICAAEVEAALRLDDFDHLGLPVSV